MRKLILLVLVFIVACVTVRKLEIAPIDYEGAAAPIVVESPVKAHLEDGSTVMFPNGITVQDGTVKGEGFKYDLTLQNREPVTELAVDEIAAMESYQAPVDKAATAGTSVVVAVGGGLGAMALLKAIFGSCPTTYSLEGDEAILEAESFSYSIAPGFEGRDIDRLGINPVGKQWVELEMRNEALETHYINHVELMEVLHADDEAVYPGGDGMPVVVRQLTAPTAAVDSYGKRLEDVVLHADDKAWRSDDARLQHVTTKDMHDHIDLEFANPPAGETGVLVLRMRNSLLNTVLLYDVMLDGQGYRALDWMGDDLNRFLPKLRLAYWYRSRMGMQVAVWDRGKFRDVERLVDTGPIAWNELAVPLPKVKGETLRVRLSFVADNWRVDAAALGTLARDAVARAVPVAQVNGLNGETIEHARDNLGSADDAYVETRPGSAMRLRFDIGEQGEGQRTYFLAAQGYYIEWMRKEWLETSSTSAFVPRDDALVTAMHRWQNNREQYRELFESTKISVR